MSWFGRHRFDVLRQLWLMVARERGKVANGWAGCGLAKVSVLEPHVRPGRNSGAFPLSARAGVSGVFRLAFFLELPAATPPSLGITHVNDEAARETRKRLRQGAVCRGFTRMPFEGVRC